MTTGSMTTAAPALGLAAPGTAQSPHALPATRVAPPRLALQHQITGQPRIAGRNLPEWAWVAGGYLIIALLLRGLTFGSPVVHIDEQFYLLVGDRMLHGALPYVDVWDRKPVGLFLLYAGIRGLGGEGFVQYQVAAMLAAAATALIIQRIARHIASPAGAWWAGVGYLLYLSGFNCFGGQATVFYNPLVALAALMTLKAWTAPDERRLLRQGAVVMALIGVALQIKYTVVFEGLGLGMALMARGWRAGWPLPRLIGANVLWCGIALAPTALALGTYSAMGHGTAFFYANFVSIFGREEPLGAAMLRLVYETLGLFPFWLAIHAGTRARAVGMPRPHKDALTLLRWWAIVAVGGFLVFGTWYDHYVTPLLVPLCVLAAPALGAWPGKSAWRLRLPGGIKLAGDARIYTFVFLIGGVVSAGLMTWGEMHNHGTRAEVEHVAQLMRARMGQGKGCAYINEGDPVLYMLTGSCFATRYVFPNHLVGRDEMYGIGVDATREMERIMAGHPPVVMIARTPATHPVNWPSRQALLAGLARDYQRYALVRVGKRQFALYSLKPDSLKPAPTLASTTPAAPSTRISPHWVDTHPGARWLALRARRPSRRLTPTSVLTHWARAFAGNAGSPDGLDRASLGNARIAPAAIAEFPVPDRKPL